MDVNQRIAEALQLPREQVEAAVALLKEKASIPFIARYRGILSEDELLRIREKFDEFSEDETRRDAALKSIGEAGKLSPEFEAKLKNAKTRDEIEDLYMAHRSRRRTRSNAAKHKGLEPLAELIRKQENSTSSVDELVKPFVSLEKGVKDMQEALSGARDIIAEQLAEDAEVRSIARELLLKEGKVQIKPREGVSLERGRYSIFANYAEPISKTPGHRMLAAMRGASEKQLYLTLEAPKEKVLEQLKAKVITNAEAPLKAELALAVEECYERLLGPALDNDLRLELRSSAGKEAIAVFAKNLRAILLQPPLGAKPVLGISAALRAPWQLAVVGADGKVATHVSVQPGKDEAEKTKAVEEFVKLMKEHTPAAIAILNNAAAREADNFIRDALKGTELPTIPRVQIHEGASGVFASSPQGREEFPQGDNALRAAVSAARRLQDPLAEIAKLDLKTVPLGQFQHEVDQAELQRALEDTARGVVAHAGVNLNTASEGVLRYVPGLNAELAARIVKTRTERGPFKSRSYLKTIEGIDDKVFEQAAGFLRVADSENPLDNTGIHPEQQALVEELAAAVGVPVKDLAGKPDEIKKIDFAKFKDKASEKQLREISEELTHPGRDARGTFVPPQFNEEVRDISELKPDMVLNGIVTNLAPFGAFIDIGVHQDGLVHISAVTHKFIRDLSEVLTVGQPVKVKILSIDPEKKRISLSMKALEEAPKRAPRERAPRGPRPGGGPARSAPATAAGQSVPAQPRQGAATGSGAQPGGDSRPRRFERPRGPRPDSAPRTAASSVAGGTVQPGGTGTADASLASLPPGEGKPSRTFRFDRGARGDRPAQGQGQGQGDRERRPPTARKPEPGKPDYSKFFVKGKRKEKERRSERPDGGASRDEVRDVIRHQNTGGVSLADLLKQAGMSEAEGEEKK